MPLCFLFRNLCVLTTMQVTDHIGPVAKAGGLGGSGAGSVAFKQPVGVAVSAASGEVYVLDAGNSRVAVMDSALRHRRYVVGVAGLEERGAVALALTRAGESMVVVNWRTRHVTELTTTDTDNPVLRQVSRFYRRALKAPYTLPVSP